MGRVPISQMDLAEIFKDRKVAENMAGAHVEEFEMGKWVVTAKQQTALKAHKRKHPVRLHFNCRKCHFEKEYKWPPFRN